MKIDKQIITIVEHLLIRDVDDGTVYFDQRVSKPKQQKSSVKKIEDNSDDKKL